MTTPHLRTSERKDFKRCQAKWNWAWRKGYKPRTARPDALWFGTGIHLALQHRYSKLGFERGFNVLQTWRDYVGDEMAMVATLSGYRVAEEIEWVQALDLGEQMLGAYLDEYGMDERWYVLSTEQSFEIDIPAPKTVKTENGILVKYNGTFDIVALDTMDYDKLWLWDHKTAKAIQTGHLTIDDQAGSYWAVAGDVLAAQGLIKPGQQLEGIMYNFLRKARQDPRPKNPQGQYLNKPSKADYLAVLGSYAPAKATIGDLVSIASELHIPVLGEVSKVQGTPNFLRFPVERSARERATQIQRITDEALHMRAVRTHQLPLLKTPTMNCQWECPFFDMCELQERGADWEDFGKMVYTRQDPYAAHRETAGEVEA